MNELISDDLGQEILAAVRELRDDLRRRDDLDTERIRAMESLKSQLHTEERRRRHLWGPILGLVFSSLLLAVSVVIVSARGSNEDDKLREEQRVSCVSANAAREVITEALTVALSDDPPEATQALLTQLQDVLAPQDC